MVNILKNMGKINYTEQQRKYLFLLCRFFQLSLKEDAWDMKYFCQTYSTSGNILLKKVLHHLYYIHIFPQILQSSRKITKVYW